MFNKFLKLKYKILFFSVLFFISFLFSNSVYASETNGTIDLTSKYAWGENIGWINFGCDNCGVAINDTAITGYAWSSKFGWINLAPTNSGVTNDPTGTLAGRAWSSNLGWIDFTGVTIDNTGEFLGYATLDSDSSQINFNCVNGGSCGSADFKVKTDWRPVNARTSPGGGSSGSAPRPFVRVVNNVSNIISNTVNSTTDFISNLFKPKVITPKTIVLVPQIAPDSLSNRWELLPDAAINSFVFAPLPYEIRILASKFPELKKTLDSVGVERLSDLGKLNGVALNIPGLTNILDKTIKNVGLNKISDINNLNGVTLNTPSLSNLDGKLNNSVGTGKIALIPGLPVAKFSLTAKNNLPSEFVFARTSGELVDLNVALSVGAKGEVAQRMSTLPGKTMRLVVKPISRARDVTGYIVFNSATPKITQNKSLISRASLTASALFSMGGLVENLADLPTEKKLVVSSFEYLDPDKDGIYTADIITPVTPGEYEIVTVIDYLDPVLGSRRMSMITVIDPEGYVFEKNNGKETRIPSAIVSLYRLNTATTKYELWKASDYSQDNPQITDIRGTYAFLVPEGSYHFAVEAPGYKPFNGKAFVVTEGSGVHQNIELKSDSGILGGFDKQTALLIVVLLLIVYDLYRNSLRNKLLEILNKENRNGNK